MKVTPADIAAATHTPLRTVRERFAAWRREGGPVTRRAPSGRGQPPWEAPLEAYCARVGLDALMIREALSGHDEAA